MKQRPRPLQIAIDGPVAAGKSVVAKRLARALAIDYLNTGSMYRLLAVHIQKNAIDVQNAKQIRAKLTEMKEAEFSSRSQMFKALDTCHAQLYTPEISAIASAISKHQRVRAQMVTVQKKFTKGKDIVVEGRDIGSVVLPNAALKIYLTADVHERTVRRVQQLDQMGMQKKRKDVAASLRGRDAQDTTRPHSPLAAAKDAVIIDTSNISIEQVVSQIVDLVHT